jgi:signal transduction histidine kinase
MKVLIAEQDQALQQQLQALCNSIGFQASIQNTVEGALKAAQTNSYDLIYTAHYLPDATGFELCREIRKQSQNNSTPIILTTKDNHQALIEKAFTAGITETFSPEQFSELESFLIRTGESLKPITGRVLLVEDSLAQQKAAKLYLEDIGLQVDTATEVDEAWQAFTANSYDLVLTDIVLEGDSSGLSLVKKIRRQQGYQHSTPIIAMSSFDDPARRIELFRLGADEYVTKPIVYEELIARVRHLVQSAKLNAALAEQKALVEQQHTALSQFMGRMSHECRNSINIISGMARLLLRKPEKLDERQQEQIRTISNAADHQLSLVNDILDYSKLQAEELETRLAPCNIQQLFIDTVELFQHTCEDKKLALTHELKDCPQEVILDARKTKQILINLVGNAVKFTEQGQITLSAYSKHDSLIFCVADTGPGIAEEDKDRLFRAFSQTQLGKSATQGTGLGLAICADFARLMGGQMSVESTPGQGSRFICSLPLKIPQ